MQPTPEHPQAGRPGLIGRKEYVEFPAWKLSRVRAKIDTGAYSSVLDVHHHEVIETSSGLLLRFCILHGRAKKPLTFEEPVVDFVAVASSRGQRERRPLLMPTIRLGAIVRTIRLTVTDRSPMRCRMLLGRQAIAGIFIVDPARKDLLTKETISRA